MREKKKLLCLLAAVCLLICNCCAQNANAAPEASSQADGYSYQQIFDRCLPSVVWLETASGGGTGFFIEENLIVTNNHVVAGAQWVNVNTADGSTYSALEIVGRSENPDLALLRIDGDGTPVSLNTHGLHEGEPVCTIGAPMGIFPTISDGIIMKSSHEDGGVDYILSNVHSIGGNSGGPLFNRYGEVIGVVVGGMSDGPNSIDLIINIRHLDDIDRENREALITREEFLRAYNTPDEENYDIVSLAEAQPGTLVKFGRYEQDNNEANGKEDILWLVKERDGNELTLLSLYCLDTMPYHEEFCAVTWESSTIRAYLNNEFFSSAFSAAEQERIVTTKVENRDNPVHGTSGGADTEDKVYLLSLEEVQRYWDITEDVETFYDGLYGQATEYCMSRPIWLEIDGVNRCWWWLRSCGSNDTQAAEVGSMGYLSFNGGAVTTAERAIRPVIHVTVE